MGTVGIAAFPPFVPFYIIAGIFLLPTTMFFAGTNTAGHSLPARLGA
jgi:hypothetical protein